jgi:drug/metabolite transporter (DMT)-like permease
MNRFSITPGLALGFLAALAYGSNVPYARMSAQAGVLGPHIVFYRSFPALALLGGIVAVSGATLRVPRQARPSVLGLGLATSCVALCYISSVAFIPVGVATIIFYTFPLIVLVASPFVDETPMTLDRIAIFLLAFIGLYIAIGPSFASLDPRGLALAAFAALGATAQFFCAARATRMIDPAAAGFWAQAFLVPIALGICLAIGGPAPFSLLAGAALPVSLTIALFVVGFVLQIFAARLAPPAALSLIFCAEPVTSIVVAAFLLDEALGRNQLLGAGFVLAAILAAAAVESNEPQRV